MTNENLRAAVDWSLICLFVAYAGGYAALRVTDKAFVLSYGTGNRELWSNIDRMPVIGPTLQAAYLPLIQAECALRHLEWSP